MRYHIEELRFDGEKILCRGWAVPEELSDRLIVTLRDEKEQRLPVRVEMSPRPDVVAAICGVENTSRDYGFSFTLAPEDRAFARLHMNAENFQIDHAVKLIEIRELVSAWRKEHTFFGKLKKKRQQRKAEKAAGTR